MKLKRRTLWFIWAATALPKMGTTLNLAFPTGFEPVFIAVKGRCQTGSRCNYKAPVAQ
jgi:hypothetical protein